MYFLKSISDDVRFAQLEFRKHSKAKRLVLGSFLSCMAAVLQAAGGFLLGIGYFISPFATWFKDTKVGNKHFILFAKGNINRSFQATTTTGCSYR